MISAVEHYICEASRDKLVLANPTWARLRDKLRVFMDFTRAVAGLSTCKRLRVGAVMCPPDLREITCFGYNGPPAGVSNDACRDVPGGCGCVHAEANALVKLRSSTAAMLMFSTRSPCEHCAGLMLNSRVVRYLVYDEAYRDPIGLQILELQGVVTACSKDLLGE